MFSENQVVMLRKVIEKWYTDTCTITNKTNVKHGNVTKQENVTILEDEPCYMSKKSQEITNIQNMEAVGSSVIKIFIAPEHLIPKGSKIAVRSCERLTEYKSSSEPAVYPTHQEIMLEIAEEKA